MDALFESAKIAGATLYDSHYGSGFIWGDEEGITHCNLNQVPEVPEYDDGDTDWADVIKEFPAAYPYVDDFEYQFHPSSNAGVDVSGDLITTLKPDIDGNIYLYHPECGIRVIHTNNDMEAV